MSAFLKNKFLRVCPYGKQVLLDIIKECEREMLILAVLSTVILILWNRMFRMFSWIYLLESIVLALCLVCMEVPNTKLQKKESKVYRELLMYFSRIKHRYSACRHIANSILDAADTMSYEIQRLAEELYLILMESDRKEKVRDYVLYNKANRYLKLFLIQAYEASEKGDLYFAENIEYLRLELMEEIYRIKRRYHEFAGYIFVTVSPFFLMPLLRQWGMEFTPELEFFYAGTGALLETVTFIATLFVYGTILRAKEIVMETKNEGEKLWNVENFYKSKVIATFVRRLEQHNGNISRWIREKILLSGERTSYGKLCLKVMVFSLGTCMILFGFFIVTHQRERNVVLGQVDSMEIIAPVASEEKKAILAEHILAITKQCRYNPKISEDEIRILLRERVRLGNRTMEQEAVKEIKKKLMQYEKAKGTIWEVVWCILAGIGVGMLPLLQLLYQIRTVQATAVYEVRQFQALILMERKLQGITVVGLLEDMEVFSGCFRGILRRCINSYSSGPEQALLQLKEDGSKMHESFEELADAFLSVDEVGIEKAFEEVESNRRLLEKMTQLEAKISMKRKKDNTEILAKIPMILAVGVYFILPFFSHSLKGVYEVFKLLEEMQQ